MCYKTVQGSVCKNTTLSPFSHLLCAFSTAIPPACGEGFQKHLDPLQKSFLFHILVCKIPCRGACSSLGAVPWPVGRQLGSPSRTLSWCGTKEMEIEVSLHKQRGRSCEVSGLSSSFWRPEPGLCWRVTIARGFVEFGKTDWICLLKASYKYSFLFRTGHQLGDKGLEKSVRPQNSTEGLPLLIYIFDRLFLNVSPCSRQAKILFLWK